MITIKDPEMLVTIPDSLPIYAGIVRYSAIGNDYDAITTGETEDTLTETIYLINTNSVNLNGHTPYQIIVNGVIYTLATDQLNPGEFEFIIVDGYAIFSVNLTGIGYLEYLNETDSTTSVPTNYIAPPYPNFVRQWDCLGQLSINKSFQSHPSINASFYTTAAESIIRTTLAKGTVHRFYGMDYEVSALTITRYSSNAIGNIYQRKVDVSFQGTWYSKNNNRSPLDNPIYLRSQLQNNPDETRVVSLSRFCEVIGVSYQGSRIEITIEPDVDPEATLSVRSELESRAIINNEFVYYSRPDAVLAKRFGYTDRHWLLKKDLKTRDYSIELPGTGAFLGDIQLVKEYRNTELQLSVKEANNGENVNQSKTYYIYSFENARNQQDVARSGEWVFSNGVYFRIDNDKKFQNNAMNWDSGGLTKAYTKTKYYNGQAIQVEYVKYGFVYISLDCYEFRQNQDGFWVAHYIGDESAGNYQIVESWSEIIVTDGDNYITDRIKSGFRMHRYQQETDALECIDLYIKYLESTDGDEQINLLQQIDTYRGQRVNFTEKTSHQLIRFDNYYKDFESDACQDNDNWYPKKFIKITETSENTELITANPAHETDSKQPPELSGGKKFISQTEVVIVNNQPGKEMYVQTEFNANEEGERFKNALKIASSTQNQGRPSEAERIDDFVEDKEITEADLNLDNKKYIINSQNSDLSLSDPIQDSVSFPDVSDVYLALSAAETQLAIDNLDAESLSMSLNNRKDWNEGDIVIFANNHYVILSIDDTQNITRGRLTSESYTIKLGRLLFPLVNLSERIKEDGCQTN